MLQIIICSFLLAILLPFLQINYTPKNESNLNPSDFKNNMSSRKLLKKCESPGLIQKFYFPKSDLLDSDLNTTKNVVIQLDENNLALPIEDVMLLLSCMIKSDLDSVIIRLTTDYKWMSCDPDKERDNKVDIENIGDVCIEYEELFDLYLKYKLN